MGWTETHKKPGMSIKAFFEQEFNSGTARILECAVVKNTAYLAYQYANGHISAIVCLIEYPDNGYYNIAYKDIDEGMGPFFYDCPPAILDMLAEPPNKNAKDWRDSCRARTI